MAVFLGFHKAPEGADLNAPGADKMMSDSWTAYCQAAKAMGLTPLGAVTSVEHGTGFCQTEASSIDEVRKAHEQANVPLEDIYEVTALHPN